MLLLSCPFLLTRNGKRRRLPFFYRRAPVGGSPTPAQILDILILNQLPDERSLPGLAPRGIIETWRTLESRQILRAPAPFSVRVSPCQPAARGGHPPKHWPPALLLRFRCSIGNRASATDLRRDLF